jgi:DNA-binding PadR family transcriptional regulator
MRGPARRVYKLTRKGESHLREWASVLDDAAKSMTRFVAEAKEQVQRAIPSVFIFRQSVDRCMLNSAAAFERFPW